MNTIKKYFYLLVVMIMAGVVFAGCNDDNRSDMLLDGSTMITSVKIGGYDAEIDNLGKTVFVGVPVDCDLSELTVNEIVLQPGAVSDIKAGEVLDCTVPHCITVTNGDVYTRYTLTVKHDDVELTTATLNGKYEGSIDNAERTVRFFVPMDEAIDAMTLSYVTSHNEAKGTPESGSVNDFTEDVILTLTYRTAVIPYTVSVIKDDMSQAPKAFIGIASDVDGLSPEAKEAASWMLSNVPNSTYVSLQDVLNGSVKLSDFRMVWCHLDWTDWPGVMWDTRDLFNDYYIKGGNILATRDGARYINDVWRIAKDQQCPNNMFGGDFAETLSDDLGFTVTGHESHPLYSGLDIDGNGKILLAGKGCSNTGRTLQWEVSWDAYGDMTVWESKTGAMALASGNDYNPNVVTIAEFAPYEILAGYTSGRVITIGTPAYEWNITNGVTNGYRGNIEKLTKNSINYLCK